MSPLTPRVRATSSAAAADGRWNCTSGEVDEQVVGVTGVHALDDEVAGDVGPGQPELAGCRGEVRRGAGRAQVQGARCVGRAERGPVVGDEAERQRAGDDRLDDLGDGHLLPLLWVCRSVVVGVGQAPRTALA